MEVINGVAVVFRAVLLVTPIIAPLGEFIPSYGILFVPLGNLENDGYLVLAGYITIIATAIYYALIFALGIGLFFYHILPRTTFLNIVAVYENGNIKIPKPDMVLEKGMKVSILVKTRICPKNYEMIYQIIILKELVN